MVTTRLPDHAKDKPIEIWFQDEARIGQQGTLTRVWAKRGTRPRAPRDQRYEWAYIFGAVCPQRGVTAALVVPTANTEVMVLASGGDRPAGCVGQPRCPRPRWRRLSSRHKSRRSAKHHAGPSAA